MVSKNDPAYRFVKQAEVKEAPRKRRRDAALAAIADRREKLRNRRSIEVVKYLFWKWMVCIGLFVGMNWRTSEGWEWEWFSLMYPILAAIVTLYHYPEWSRKRKAEREQ